MKKLLKFLGLVLLLVLVVAGGALGYLFAGYPSVGELPAVTLPTDPERIERGRYLARNVAMCVECHSSRDWSRYAGPMVEDKLGAGGEEFAGGFGTVYAPNITPAGIGSWSDQQLYAAVATGVTVDGTSLFPIMPYPHYGAMDQRDLEDILAYIRTLEPVEHQVPAGELNFPLNLIVRTMPAAPQHQPRPAETDTVAYGRYLLNAASCADCHTPQEKGAPIPGMTLAGGFEFTGPWGTVRSANITPDKQTGIGTWTREQFIERFKGPEQRHNRGDRVAAGEFNTIMPWGSYAGMTEQDLGALYDYLMTVEPVNNRVQVSSAP